MSLRDELDELIRFEASESSAMQTAMLHVGDTGDIGERSRDDYLEMLYALHLGLKAAVLRLADHVERLEARLGPEDPG